ncbi:hypothetical protein [Anaerovorax odorimutans]|uniref:hypothetical protein n=1 Tax=Anaerovorax odorimutans TaxID=109327 RepID=UPI0003FCC7C2|nr:hypothetical protein [Anaerovorax odorimutans]
MKILVEILVLCVLLSGCGNNGTIQEKKSAASSDKIVSEQTSDIKTTSKKKTAILYTNMETGSESGEFQTHSFKYSGKLTAKTLAKGLSQLTGLDFIITVSNKDENIYIDWAQDSTLIANLDDREQYEEFFFFDCDSMRWFMMDSLWRTLKENLGVENVYYTMNGGKDLVFDALYPIKEFPADVPYMGSAFYSAHANVKGDEPICEEDAFELVQHAINFQGENVSTIVKTGDEIIEGEHAFTFSAGDDSADGQKYTAVSHYAVSDSGRIYYMDVLKGADWISLDI